MKNGFLFLCGFAAVAFGPPAGAQHVSGSGASVPSPLVQCWAADWSQAGAGPRATYKTSNSADGLRELLEKKVDFAVSDFAPRPEDVPLEEFAAIPVAAAGLVLAYNLPGVENLKLSGEALAGIFLGKISRWNDPVLVRDNPSARLPDLPVNIVRRSDRSGTTFVFGRYLAGIDQEFAGKIAESMSSKAWPVGVGAEGSEGVTALIKRSPGAAGCVGYAFARENELSMALLQNREGVFVPPSSAEVVAVEDPAGKNGYPLVAVSHFIFARSPGDPGKSAALRSFLTHALTAGQKTARELGYLPLPPEILQQSRRAVEAAP